MSSGLLGVSEQPLCKSPRRRVEFWEKPSRSSRQLLTVSVIKLYLESASTMRPNRRTRQTMQPYNHLWLMLTPLKSGQRSPELLPQHSGWAAGEPGMNEGSANTLKIILPGGGFSHNLEHNWQIYRYTCEHVEHSSKNMFKLAPNRLEVGEGPGWPVNSRLHIFVS